LLTFAFALDDFESLPQNLVLFGLIGNFEISDLAMAKIDKINITVKYQFCKH
jgi:hypothetical protein